MVSKSILIAFFLFLLSIAGISNAAEESDGSSGIMSEFREALNRERNINSWHLLQFQNTLIKSQVNENHKDKLLNLTLKDFEDKVRSLLKKYNKLPNKIDIRFYSEAGLIPAKNGADQEKYDLYEGCLNDRVACFIVHIEKNTKKVAAFMVLFNLEKLKQKDEAALTKMFIAMATSITIVNPNLEKASDLDVFNVVDENLGNILKIKKGECLDANDEIIKVSFCSKTDYFSMMVAVK